MAGPRPKLIEKIDISLLLRENALTLWKDTEVTWLYATGVNLLSHQKSDGDGLLVRKPGIDGIMANGITGDHQKEVSPQLDGPGIKDTGIIQAMYSNISVANGGDSKEANGYSTTRKFQWDQEFQENNPSVGHSLSWRNTASQPAYLLGDCQDAKLAQAESQLFTIGKMLVHADS